jgi:hypothetical protein
MQPIHTGGKKPSKSTAYNICVPVDHIPNFTLVASKKVSWLDSVLNGSGRDFALARILFSRAIWSSPRCVNNRLVEKRKWGMRIRGQWETGWLMEEAPGYLGLLTIVGSFILILSRGRNNQRKKRNFSKKWTHICSRYYRINLKDFLPLELDY